MENSEFEKFCIKNRACYYFDDIIKFEDFDFDNILIDGKAHKNILIYDISQRILIGALCIRFNKVDGVFKVYDGTRYLTLFGSEKYDDIYKGIRCLMFFSLLHKNQS